jgi:hypothetical protein
MTAWKERERVVAVGGYIFFYKSLGRLDIEKLSSSKFFFLFFRHVVDIINMQGCTRYIYIFLFLFFFFFYGRGDKNKAPVSAPLSIPRLFIFFPIFFLLGKKKKAKKVKRKKR